MEGWMNRKEGGMEEEEERKRERFALCSAYSWVYSPGGVSNTNTLM